MAISKLIPIKFARSQAWLKVTEGSDQVPGSEEAWIKSRDFHGYQEAYPDQIRQQLSLTQSSIIVPTKPTRCQPGTRPCSQEIFLIKSARRWDWHDLALAQVRKWPKVTKIACPVQVHGFDLSSKKLRHIKLTSICVWLARRFTSTLAWPKVSGRSLVCPYHSRARNKRDFSNLREKRDVINQLYNTILPFSSQIHNSMTHKKKIK